MKSQELIVSGKLFKVFPQNSPTKFAWRQSWTKWKNQGSQVDLLDRLRSSKNVFSFPSVRDADQKLLLPQFTKFCLVLASSRPSTYSSPTGHPEARKNTMAALTVHTQSERGSYIIKQKWHCFFAFSPFSLGNQAPVRLANQFCL